MAVTFHKQLKPTNLVSFSYQKVTPFCFHRAGQLAMPIMLNELSQLITKFLAGIHNLLQTSTLTVCSHIWIRATAISVYTTIPLFALKENTNPTRNGHYRVSIPLQAHLRIIYSNTNAFSPAIVRDRQRFYKQLDSI